MKKPWNPKQRRKYFMLSPNIATRKQRFFFLYSPTWREFNSFRFCCFDVFVRWIVIFYFILPPHLFALCRVLTDGKYKVYKSIEYIKSSRMLSEFSFSQSSQPPLSGSTSPDWIILRSRAWLKSISIYYVVTQLVFMFPRVSGKYFFFDSQRKKLLRNFPLKHRTKVSK